MKGRSLVLRHRSVMRSEIPHFRPELKVKDLGLPAVMVSDSTGPENMKLNWPSTEKFTEIVLIQLFIDEVVCPLSGRTTMVSSKLISLASKVSLILLAGAISMRMDKSLSWGEPMM